jgi:primosomal protein N'
VTPDLPRAPESFLGPIEQKKSVEPPSPAFKEMNHAGQGGQPGQASQAGQAGQAVPTKFDRPDPAAAAATLDALTPTIKTKPMIEATPYVPPSQPAPAADTPPAERQLSKKELQAINKARKQAFAAEAERQQKAKEEQKQLAEKQKVELEKQKAEAERQKKEDEKKAKEQAELEKKQQKEMAELEAKLKSAQAAFDAAAKGKRQ